MDLRIRFQKILNQNVFIYLLSFKRATFIAMLIRLSGKVGKLHVFKNQSFSFGSFFKRLVFLPRGIRKDKKKINWTELVCCRSTEAVEDELRYQAVTSHTAPASSSLPVLLTQNQA